MEVHSGSTAVPAPSSPRIAKEPSGMASSKLSSPEKKKKHDFSRPVSTSSGNSMTSAVETQESASSRMVDSHDSLSTMPTPRNTFLYPPTGINLSDKGSTQPGSAGTLAGLPIADWDSDQHQRQLQLLLERRGVSGETGELGADTDVDVDAIEHPEAPLQQLPVLPSYDDSYYLLSQSASVADGPESRDAAVALLQRLAGSLDCENGTRRTHIHLFNVPSPLAPPLEALEQLEEGLAGIVTRRQVPNRTRSTVRSSVIVPVSSPAVSVRDITPASRLALWLTMHSTVEANKTTLWRRKQWQRRFAIFAGNVLYLFKSSAPAATALSIIRLSSSTIVCVNDSFQGRSWVIEITLLKSADIQPPVSGTVLPASISPQSWYLQTEMRNEMVALLKQLKAAVNDLQVQPDVERKEEERLRSRRKKQRKEARNKTDVCPWEVDEFSDRSSDPVASDLSEGSDDGELLGLDDRGVFRIPDDELFPSDDDDEHTLDKTGDAKDAAHLDAYSMGGAAKSARPTTLKTHDYTGTGGIAEWGAHRLQMPYNPASSSGGLNAASNKVRSFSVDPAPAVVRRPSLADALAPPISAMQEYTPIAGQSPSNSPRGLPQTIRTRSAMAGFFSSAARNSMMLKSDASALIEQMFASASRELSTPGTAASGGNGALSGGNLFVVREEE
ncbi:hypothetical protein GGI21_003545 [Coemansia aciculifera]|nr:hypothetical protein GGI21_003545 [Coemansia aciculifera]